LKNIKKISINAEVSNKIKKYSAKKAERLKSIKDSKIQDLSKLTPIG
jgi:hypothetical protein